MWPTTVDLLNHPVFNVSLIRFYFFSLVASKVTYGFMLFVITVDFGRLHDDMKLENVD